jgi:hypothetical protein
MRPGRSFIDALGTLAERLVIPEAWSLVAVLRQSVELGPSDAGAAELRITTAGAISDWKSERPRSMFSGFLPTVA